LGSLISRAKVQNINVSGVVFAETTLVDLDLRARAPPGALPRRRVPFERIQEWKCFDADNGKESAREIREYYIPDFSNWKGHDEYKQAFDWLLRDLKPTTEASK
jgi:hypothetical protein